MSPDSPLLLCPKHYTALHRQFHASEPSVSCGIKPKQGKCFTRHCPNAAINEILRESNVDSNQIQETDYVCDACYKTHLSMLKHTDETYDNKKLMTLIKSWITTLADDIIDVTRATLHTVLHVANEIMNERLFYFHMLVSYLFLCTQNVTANNFKQNMCLK